MKATEVRAMDIRVVVADPEWQTLRASFVGQWKKNGATCAERLRSYYETNPNDPFRVRRVLNYLTGSGFRMGAIQEPGADSLREEVRQQWAYLQTL